MSYFRDSLATFYEENSLRILPSSPQSFWAEFLVHLNEDVRSQTSLKAMNMAESGDWAGVASLSVTPRNYDSAEAYFLDVIPTCLKKCAELSNEVVVDTKVKTTAKWIEAEKQCYRTNRRLSIYRDYWKKRHDGEVFTVFENGLASHLWGIRKIIRSWIGDRVGFPDLYFSPGSTATDRGRKSTVAHKLRGCPSTTLELDQAGYPGFIGTKWHHNMVDGRETPAMSVPYSPVVIPGEVYFTVPKRFDEERPAAMQPSLNASLQLGYGRELRGRLKASTGWDLTRGKENHMRLAQEASLTCRRATLDSVSASDMMAKVLVELLLSDNWYSALNAVRCHRITESPISKLPYTLEKFSAMGNGFTFELESIIFGAIACHVHRFYGRPGLLGKDVFVFGDDLIVDDDLATEVTSLMHLLGFKVNTEKSFSGSVPFRESCGGDYFHGHNVRNFYAETCPATYAEVVRLANKVAHCSDRLSALCTGRDLRNTWRYVLSHLPRGMRDVRGPSNFGDLVLYSPNPKLWSRRKVKTVLREQVSVNHSRFGPVPMGYRFVGRSGEPCVALEQRTFKPQGVKYVPFERFDPATQLACAVIGHGSQDRGFALRENLVPRPNRLKSIELECTWSTLFYYDVSHDMSE